MKISKPILTETAHVAVGVLIGDALMCGVFALLGKFDMTVLWGALLGSALAVGSFFLLGLSLQRGLEMGDRMPQHMRSSYSLRMGLLVLGLALAAILPCFNLIAAVVPQFFPRLTIFAMQLLGIYKPESKQTEKGDEEP